VLYCEFNSKPEFMGQKKTGAQKTTLKMVINCNKMIEINKEFLSLPYSAKHA